jgi:hypothetical protein
VGRATLAAAPPDAIVRAIPATENSLVIVRVLHEQQYELDGNALNRLNALDEQIFQSVVGNDAKRYKELMQEALSLIRGSGRALADDDLRASDLVLPAPDSTMEEVRSLFQQEGLIEG